ncbi:hypothetical protein PSTT_00698 [Puccinia striiformis]|uniref:Uncharacterized protein n=1 Tax=Puccinia striiformis TaxID=27350 RepID=A0A2S4W699_9BASI|nr:hypothetical protein PSTT_00698 [Puccinia striiformis]
MQDFIFLSSNVFFIDTRDSLAFIGNFTGNSGPYLRSVPNGGPLELNRVRADGGDGADDARKSIQVNVTFRQRSEFKLRSGKSYALEGEITQLDNNTTLIFHVERSAAIRELPGPELVDLGPVKVTGIGTIISVRYFYGDEEEPYWGIVVDHEHRGREDAAVQVSYIISADNLDVPPNTVFKLGTRICLVGNLVEVGGGLGTLTIKVR